MNLTKNRKEFNWDSVESLLNYHERGVYLTINNKLSYSTHKAGKNLSRLQILGENPRKARRQAGCIT